MVDDYILLKEGISCMGKGRQGRHWHLRDIDIKRVLWKRRKQYHKMR